jgi:deoxyribodipyrimidine photolyase-related protein
MSFNGLRYQLPVDSMGTSLPDEVSTLRLILGDQLNINHSWFAKVDPAVVYVMAEIRSETDYARHHIQKVAAIFFAMRHFAHELRRQGHTVYYQQITHEDAATSFPQLFQRLCSVNVITSIEVMEPDEYRLDGIIREVTTATGILVKVVSTEHFYTHRDDLTMMFPKRTSWVMERFYRTMRRKHGILMDGSQPQGGTWNYDAENRKKWNGAPVLSPVHSYRNDCTQVVEDIRKAGITTIGTIDERNLIWPCTRLQALDALNDFVQNRLPWFGPYQDAMTHHSWTLFHSRLSFALNVKLLSPHEVVQAACESTAPLASVEGFVRQILGWREFVRGVYWATMPSYAAMNALGHRGPLPEWFWTGDTAMRCVSHAVRQSLDHAYAHHIQRLMITGNIALLVGAHPDAVDAWYLGIYIDAFEWVEMPNTRGMSQAADGGIVGTKPYVSSAAYIDRMSDYCRGCAYNRKERTGEQSCPFNALYWHFHHRHRPSLQKNHRLAMLYTTWDAMAAETRKEILERGDWLIEHVHEL